MKKFTLSLAFAALMTAVALIFSGCIIAKFICTDCKIQMCIFS